MLCLLLGVSSLEFFPTSNEEPPRQLCPPRLSPVHHAIAQPLGLVRPAGLPYALSSAHVFQVRRDIRQKFGDIGPRFYLEAFNGFLPALKLVLDLQVHHDAI